MHVRYWEIIVPQNDQPICIVAYTKAEAIQTAIELCPGINPLAVTIREQTQWN
jgi:hypothetical protein